KDEGFAGIAGISCNIGGVTCSHDSKSHSEHIDEFHKLVGDLAAIDTAISDKDQALLLLTSLPSSYDNFMETLLYGRDTMKLEDVVATLNFRKLQKMTKAKGDGGEGFYVRGRSGQRDIEHGTYSAWSKSQGRSSRLGCNICQSEEHLKRDCPRYNHKKSQGYVRIEDHVSGSGADGYDTINVMMAMNYDGGNILLGGDSRECRVRGTCKVQVHMRDGSSFVLENVRYVSELRQNLISLGTRRANCVYTLDGQAVTRKTLKGRKQLGEYQIGWKIKTGNVLDFCNQRYTQQCTKSGVAKHLGVAGLQQQNGLVEETNVTLLAKVKYIFLGYRKGAVGNKALEVLQGVEFEVEPQEDHTFEVEPRGNVDHVVGSHEVQTQDLIYSHLARDKEQHSTRKLFNYREDSNEVAFAVAEAEKIYAHESLIFDNTVACEVKIWAIKGLLDKAKENVLGMEIVRDQSEKNGKWSCIYAVGSQEYQMLYTRLDIASADIEAAKEAIWLKGLAIESGFELMIVAGIAIRALSKAVLGSRLQLDLKLLRIEDF
ncbi:zinc finger, CCHC-type containing protein, partial [Tanacetum coccineum]